MNSEVDRLRLRIGALEKLVEAQEQSVAEETVRHEAVRAEADAARELLRVISEAQSRFIGGSDSAELFDGLLADLLRLTSSEYGFLSEVLFEVDGTPYLETRGLTDFAWDDEKRERFRSLYRFFNRVMITGAPLVSNDPARDLRSTRSGTRARMRAFLGLPIVHGTTMVGVAGILNRPGGYDQRLVESLEPFLATCANLIEAHRSEVRRRESECALLESEARVRAVVDTALDGIVTIDECGIIDQVNPAFERMFGYSAGELARTHLSALITWPDSAPSDPDHSGPFAEIHGVVLGTGREVIGRRKDGTTLPVEAVFSEMSTDGGRMYTGVLRDVSERKRIDRLKSEFITTVNHELRTPLTSIRGSLGLLVGGVAGPLAPQAREMVAIALRNSERLGRLIDDILDIERIESARIEFRPRYLDLAEVVRRSIEANHGYATSHGVRLELVGHVPPAAVFADEDRLSQVLSNLISNAAKFSPQGETVEVSIVHAGVRVRVGVRDRGPGIPAEFTARIFQRFAQADNSDTREKGGTGLGLSIAKALVERMGGRIGFEPAEFRGTTFFFELPARRIRPFSGDAQEGPGPVSSSEPNTSLAAS